MKTYHAVSGLLVTAAGAWCLRGLGYPGSAEPADVYFVVLLVIASLILCAGTLYVRNRFRGLARALEGHADRASRPPAMAAGLLTGCVNLLRFGDDDPDKLLSLVFDLRLSLLCGVAYGAAFASVPFLFADHAAGQSEKIRLLQYDLLQHGLTELSIRQYDRLRQLDETIRNNAKTIARHKTVGVKSFAALTGVFPLVLDAGRAVPPTLADTPEVQNLIGLTVVP